MAHQRILNRSQAVAVCNAMSHINNVAIAYWEGSGLSISFFGNVEAAGNEPKQIEVVEVDGGLIVSYGLLDRERETYPSQAAFATAYGLD